MESSSKGAEDGCTRVKFSRLNLVDLAGGPAAALVLLLTQIPPIRMGSQSTNNPSKGFLWIRGWMCKSQAFPPQLAGLGVFGKLP